MDANLAFETSLAVAKEHIAAREYAAAWLALERAHVCGVASRDAREVFGQLVRLVLSIPATVFRAMPQGTME